MIYGIIHTFFPWLKMSLLLCTKFLHHLRLCFLSFFIIIIFLASPWPMEFLGTGIRPEPQLRPQVWQRRILSPIELGCGLSRCLSDAEMPLIPPCSSGNSADVFFSVLPVQPIAQRFIVLSVGMLWAISNTKSNQA